MFKLMIVGGLLYILYNMVMKRSQIPGRKEEMKIRDDKQTDNGEYVDYEEID